MQSYWNPGRPLTSSPTGATGGKLYALAAAALIFNLLDAVFTLTAVSAGLAEEANPLMAELLATSPVAFVIGKMSLVSLGILLLWRLRWRRTAAVAITGTAVVYGAVVAYHLTQFARLA